MPISMVGVLSGATPVGAVVVIDRASRRLRRTPDVRPIARRRRYATWRRSWSLPRALDGLRSCRSPLRQKLPAFRVAVEPKAIEQACDAIGGSWRLRRHDRRGRRR